MDDKMKVLRWMSEHCYGARKAKIFRDIYPAILDDLQLSIKDRDGRGLRQILSDLRHEGLIASHNSDPKGYWFIPLHTNDPYEIEAVIRSLSEKKSKSLSMLKDIDGQLSYYEEKLLTSKGEQQEFQFVGGENER